MKQRSAHNWKTKSGSWDPLNTRFIEEDAKDYPLLSSFDQITEFETVMINDYKNINENSLTSTFLDDYILERFWNNPLKYIPILKKAKFTLSPDFSLLIGMPDPMLRWNIYRNRLIGNIWQRAGIKVIPTVSWTDEASLKYSFLGIGKFSNVAISNSGCRSPEQIEFFNKGFQKLKEEIEPKKIIFQSNKKLRTNYTDKNLIFINSFWDNKRQKKWEEDQVNQ
jgi:hypothetical protein